MNVIYCRKKEKKSKRQKTLFKIQPLRFGDSSKELDSKGHSLEPTQKPF
jgi:hypothetical protein